MSVDPYSALANPVRRGILDALRTAPMAVNDIVRLFELSRPAVSEHLGVLRDAALVTQEPCGRKRMYRLTAGPLAEVDDWLHPFERYWRDRLADLATVLDEQQKEARS